MAINGGDAMTIRNAKTVNVLRECINCHHLETIGAHCAVTNGSHVFAINDPFQDAIPCWHVHNHTQRNLDCGLYGFSSRYY